MSERCSACASFLGSSSRGGEDRGQVHCTKPDGHEGRHVGLMIISDGILSPVEWDALMPPKWPGPSAGRFDDGARLGRSGGRKGVAQRKKP